MSDEKGWLLEWLHHFQPDRTFNLEDFIRALVRHLAGVLLDAVNSKTVGCIAAQPGLRKNRRKHTGRPLWPTGAGQLLPHGLERSVQGYAASFRICDEIGFTDVLLFVNKLLSICGQEAVPLLLEHDPEWPTRIVRLALSLVQDRRETLGTRVDPRIEIDWMNPIGQIAEFCELVANLTQDSPTIVVRFVDVRAEGSDEVHSSDPLFVCDFLVKNLTLFHVGTEAFREGLVAIFRQHFAHHGALFYSHKPASDRTLYDATIIEEHMASSASFDDPLVAFEGLAWAAGVRHCCAPGCQETFATAQRSFSRCAGCGAVRYCSRLCQRRAWKHEDYPHKLYCAVLRTLKEKAKPPKGHDVACPRQHFIDICHADDRLLALARLCSAHLFDLTMARRQSAGVKAM